MDANVTNFCCTLYNDDYEPIYYKEGNTIGYKFWTNRNLQIIPGFKSGPFYSRGRAINGEQKPINMKNWLYHEGIDAWIELSEEGINENFEDACQDKIDPDVNWVFTNTCRHCETQFQSAHSLTQHMDCHNNERKLEEQKFKNTLTCKVLENCRFEGRIPVALEIHERFERIAIKTRQPPKKPVKCDQCIYRK